MGRIKDVIKNKNRIERAIKARRKEEIESIRNDALFKSNLHDEINKLDLLLESKEIDSVVIEVDNSMLGKFSTAIYTEELADFDIRQVENEPNSFIIKRKVVTF